MLPVPPLSLSIISQLPVFIAVIILVSHTFLMFSSSCSVLCLLAPPPLILTSFFPPPPPLPSCHCYYYNIVASFLIPFTFVFVQIHSVFCCWFPFVHGPIEKFNKVFQFEIVFADGRRFKFRYCY